MIKHGILGNPTVNGGFCIGKYGKLVEKNGGFSIAMFDSRRFSIAMVDSRRVHRMASPRSSTARPTPSFSSLTSSQAPEAPGEDKNEIWHCVKTLYPW